jgi:hypothetical protein
MRCPGQDMQYWKPGAIFEAECPRCGRPVEFFKDDTARTCGACGHRFVNPQMDFGCAAYCPYAEQCLGTLPEGLADQKEALLKDRVAVEMKRRLKSDFKRIGRAGRVARYAERIGKAEKGNLALILSAAYLMHLPAEIGAETAEALASAARTLLEKLGAREQLIEGVCRLISPEGDPGTEESAGRRILADAVRLAELEEALAADPAAAGRSADPGGAAYLTASGRSIARELFNQPR